MKSAHALILAAVFVVHVPALAAAQQRPLVTEDPETVGVNRVLVEGGMEFGKDQAFPAYGLKGDTTHGPTIGVSVGVGASAEVQVDADLLQRIHIKERTSTTPPIQPTFTGDDASSFGDVVVATKLRIVSETERMPGFGVRFGTKLPTASTDSGLGLGTTDFFAALLVAKTVQSVRTVGNMSLLVLGNTEDARESVQALGFGLSVARAITNAFEAVGEVNGHLKPMGESVPVGLDSRGMLRLGVRYTHQLLRLDVGALVGITPRDPTFGISAGATYVFTN